MPAIYRALEAYNPAFLWESSDNQDRSTFFSFHKAGRFSYIGLSPTSTHIIHNHELLVRLGNNSISSPTTLTLDPMDYAHTLLGNTFDDRALHESGLEMPFAGGLAGFISYDAARYFEQIKGAGFHPSEPDFLFFCIGNLVVVDNDKELISILLWHEDNPESKDIALETSRALQAHIQQATSVLLTPVTKTGINPQARLGRDEFISIVERAKEYIRAGDIFQVVISNSFALGDLPDPLSLYTALKASNPSPYHHLFTFGGQNYVGASPEVMLRGLRKDNQDLVFMRPVAGTFPRHPNQKLDEERVKALASNEKELAEHVMLVDLERNDIGRVASPGTVTVTDLCSVETYSHVHHLVSQVSGVLRNEENVFSALRSCFPIGTLAGTPKIRAMEIIAELESSPRGIFGGCLFLADPRGNFDSTVAIRGMVIRNDSAVMKSGAGIVFDSDAGREYEECMWKCRAMDAALERLSK